MRAVVPPYMVPTVELLRRAFPSGIPECDLLPLMAVLGDAGMSNRSVAAAVGYYYGKDSTAFSYQAHICTVDETVSDLTKFAIREYLRKFGFDDWVASST